MKVLQINQTDIAGGAAIAGYRLHQGLLDQGIDSRLLVGAVKSTSERATMIPRSTPNQRRLENQITRFTRRLSLNYIHIVNTFDIPKHSLYQEADILNFHNIHTGYFNYLALPALTKTKPSIFTLHDMWSFTGHCSYSYDCERWKIGCGKCPYPDIYPAIKRDSTRLEWKLKNWTYKRANLTIVTPSSWLAEQVKQSMLNHLPIHHIPNGIDTGIYQPLNPEQGRSLLGIPPGKKVLMFAAHTPNDIRKGGKLLFEVLKSLPESLRAETILLILGDGGEAFAETVGIQTLNLGFVRSDRLKALAYSVSDLFVFPTRADNLPLVLQESMACGTPMVSFNIGGVPDLVRPGITGYLAEPEDAKDFYNGIVQLLENQELRDRMRQECRKIALKEFSLELQAQRYIELYRQTLPAQ